MTEQFSRTVLLIGEENLKRLRQARVAVFGIGGVGGYTVEALARSGIGTLDLIDNDRVCLSNLNRQILATGKTVGQYKVDVARDRILEIDPDIKVNCHRVFYLPDTAMQFDFTEYDYVVDAIDTVTGKLMLVEQAKKAGTPVISCMGAGNKLDASAFKVADISETRICPLAKVMRKELKKRGIEHLKVVYSEEPAKTPATDQNADRNTDRTADRNTDQPGRRRRSVPGSIAFVPGTAGLIMAGEVVRDLIAGCGAGQAENP